MIGLYGLDFWRIRMKLSSLTKKITDNKTTLTLSALGLGAYLYKKRSLKGILTPALLALPLVAIMTPAHAQISQSSVMAYANAMQSAANNQNISQIARLISDNAVISLTRQGKGGGTLTKSEYLDLLQKSWTKTSNYRYSIHIDNIVITGDTARVSVVTKETWVKDGQTHTLTTTSKTATLGLSGNNVVLTRLVAEVAIN